MGLLGGSFNPAHDGHLHLSLTALKRLRLDRVVWLVSPQNPLKDRRDMKPFTERFQSAERVARHPGIVVSDLEQRLQTRYTADTLSILVERAPRTRFVWLMGADNLIQFHRWQHWQDIAGMIPITVFSRPGYVHQLASAKAAEWLKPWRIDESDATRLAGMSPPAWTIIHMPLHGASSTAIRENGVTIG